MNDSQAFEGCAVVDILHDTESPREPRLSKLGYSIVYSRRTCTYDDFQSIECSEFVAGQHVELECRVMDILVIFHTSHSSFEPPHGILADLALVLLPLWAVSYD